MLDREGFRPNVGIILLNAHNEVFWGKRLREHSWQFPQGGIKYGETPVQAMYRELHEETGLLPEHVKVIGRTRDWLRYEVPDKFIKRERLFVVHDNVFFNQRGEVICSGRGWTIRPQ